MVAGFWFLFVPNWRPPLHDGERYGIDVSNHQGEIDWQAVADDDIDFAYIKASEGGDFTDARFAANWRGADDAGLDRGAYHFFTLCRSGRDQARHFLSVAPPDPAALPPAVDLELAGNCGRRPSAAEVDAELRAFLAGRRDRVGPARDPLRRRRLGGQVSRFGRSSTVRSGTADSFVGPNVDGWVIWQIHGYARVDGISGGVDLDIMRT